MRKFSRVKVDAIALTTTRLAAHLLLAGTTYYVPPEIIAVALAGQRLLCDDFRVRAAHQYFSKVARVENPDLTARR